MLRLFYFGNYNLLPYKTKSHRGAVALLLIFVFCFKVVLKDKQTGNAVVFINFFYKNCIILVIEGIECYRHCTDNFGCPAAGC